MKIPFREYHLFRFLNDFDKQQLPVDVFISIYFRNNPSLGSKDRAEISETVYRLIRWKGLIDHLTSKPLTWENRFLTLKNFTPEEHRNPTIPLPIRCSFPPCLFTLLENNYGAEEAEKLCLASNHQAPTTIRVNIQKISRADLFQRWKNHYAISLCQYSPWGIIFHRKIHFFSLPEFKEGLFEIQDEGSQLVAQLANPQPGEQILDYCSGAGGKSLAMAPLMQNRGQLYLHDIRSKTLVEAKRRLHRAGIQNAQIHSSSSSLKSFKKKMDCVLVDVPCSGTGTLRRNPDIKWRFDEGSLKRLIGQQRDIFEKALSYVRPGGRIVYATCSLLSEENQLQLEHFTKTYDLKVEGQPFQSFPKPGGMDGFFGAILTLK